MSLDSIGDHGGGVSTGSGGIGDYFYPLYKRVFGEDSQFANRIEGKLKEARMSYTVEMYLSRALGIGTITGLMLWMIGLAVGWLFLRPVIEGVTFLPASMPEAVLSFFETFKLPAGILLVGIVLGGVGFLLGFGVLAGVPYSRANSRRREINMLLPDAISFMYALSVGGLNQLEILEAMAQAEDTYGEVAREFQSIVHETEYFDTDYKTAIRNQALESPSDELAQFLTDMLSIVNSGGDMESFLNEKKDKHMRTAKQQQEMTLETLELFGEMYMTLSLFPLLLIIILVIMRMLGEAGPLMLPLTVYAMIPLTGVAFLVLISTVKKDDPGDGYLRPGDSSDWLENAGRGGLLDLGLVEKFTGDYSIFNRIENREGTYETMRVLSNPHIFFRDNPLYTLALTVPAALVLMAIALVSGNAPTAWGGPETPSSMMANPIWGTFVYVYLPVYVVLVPLGFFYEWNVRSRHAIIADLSDDLRKLSSANDTGLTLLESVETVSRTTSGKIAEEFNAIHTKVNYGMSLKEALVEFNNKYHVPRLARTIKLISKSQEASSQITDVLSTAAAASENQDDIERERKSRSRMQVVIIIMTYLTLLAVMAILKTQFLDVMAGVVEQGGGSGTSGTSFAGSIQPSKLSMMFFHAVTIQAILSGFISGYMRDADILSGVKYTVALLTIALVAWAVVESTGGATDPSAAGSILAGLVL
jgi:flagellar protein FlaJ